MHNFKITAVVVAIMLTCGLVLQSFVQKSIVEVVPANAVGEFKKLGVEGCINVVLTQGPASEARIEGDEKLVSNIEFEKNGDELTVKFKDEKMQCQSNQSVTVYLSAPAVADLNLAGSGNITSTNTLTANGDCRLDIAGSGDIIVSITAAGVKANIAGSGNIVVDGKATSVEIDIAGSGNFKGDKLIVGDVDIEIAGSGNAYVNNSGNLTASIAGSGDVLYSGSPSKINKDIAGSGKVKAAK